jgi:hypothetical protein
VKSGLGFSRNAAASSLKSALARYALVLVVLGLETNQRSLEEIGRTQD